LHDTYGGFIDALVLDALYANGPVMTQITNYGYGGFLVLKKENNEPFKEARKLWEIEGACQSYEDRDRKEQGQFWDVDDIETLETYKGKSPRGPRRGQQGGPREAQHVVLRHCRPACAPGQSSPGATDHPGALAHRKHRV
jgi:hypothetical protein